MIVYFSPVPYSTNALFSPPRVISSLKVHVPIVKQNAFSIFWKFLFHPDDVNTGRIINYDICREFALFAKWTLPKMS